VQAKGPRQGAKTDTPWLDDDATVQALMVAFPSPVGLPADADYQLLAGMFARFAGVACSTRFNAIARRLDLAASGPCRVWTLSCCNKRRGPSRRSLGVLIASPHVRESMMGCVAIQE
jgi:hypothetical protein